MENKIKRLKSAVAHLADIHVQYCNDMDVAFDLLSTEVMELEEDFKKRSANNNSDNNAISDDKLYQKLEDVIKKCGLKMVSDLVLEDISRLNDRNNEMLRSIFMSGRV